MRETDTSRTGVEQLLISTAVDRSLSKVDFKPIAHAKVYLEEKYLDCTDKNYILVSLHQKLLHHNCTIVDKPEEADVVMQVASGGVGTDRNEMFVGIPEIPLAPPSPVMVPKLTLYSRTKAMGTAKLSIVAYDTKSKLAVINSGHSLARADYRNWTVLGAGGTHTGAVPTELAQATGDHESFGGKALEMIATQPKSTTTTSVTPPDQGNTAGTTAPAYQPSVPAPVATPPATPVATAPATTLSAAPVAPGSHMAPPTAATASVMTATVK